MVGRKHNQSTRIRKDFVYLCHFFVFHVHKRDREQRARTHKSSHWRTHMRTDALAHTRTGARTRLRKYARTCARTHLPSPLNKIRHWIMYLKLFASSLPVKRPEMFDHQYREDDDSYHWCHHNAKQDAIPALGNNSRCHV